MIKYNVVLKGYCDTILDVYTIEASTKEEASQIAIDKYVSDIEISFVDDEEANDIKQDLFIDSLMEDN